jgi:hypothetical protein
MILTFALSVKTFVTLLGVNLFSDYFYWVCCHCLVQMASFLEGGRGFLHQPQTLVVSMGHLLILAEELMSGVKLCLWIVTALEAAALLKLGSSFQRRECPQRICCAKCAF